MGGSRASGNADLVRDVEAEKQEHVDASLPPPRPVDSSQACKTDMACKPSMCGCVEGDLSSLSDSSAEKTLISVMACVLEQLVTRNDQLPFDPATATVFHGLRSPNVSVRAYLQRIHKYTNVSTGCLVCALLYIDRFMQRNKSILLTSRSVHRLLITSVVVSMKFLDDLYYNNVYYAKIGGIPTSEMNSLELEFLFRLNFDLHAPQEEYERYKYELHVHASRATNCSCAQENFDAAYSPPLAIPFQPAVDVDWNQPNHIQRNHIQPNHIQPNHIQPNHIQPNLIQPNHIQAADKTAHEAWAGPNASMGAECYVGM